MHALLTIPQIYEDFSVDSASKDISATDDSYKQASSVYNLNTSLFLSINLLSADEEISLFSVYKNMFDSQGIMYNKGTKAPHEWGNIDRELHVFLKIRKLS